MKRTTEATAATCTPEEGREDAGEGQGGASRPLPLYSHRIVITQPIDLLPKVSKGPVLFPVAVSPAAAASCCCCISC